MIRLPASFFDRDTVAVARDLLGKQLVRNIDGRRLIATIVETEAYCGEQDTACHAHKGRTPRTQVMYGPPGHYYVYLIYGLYHMLNIVTRGPGCPEAVLIRALLPVQGMALMSDFRGVRRITELTNGPGKLCQALAIDRTFNGQSVEQDDLFIQAGKTIKYHQIHAAPRIGIEYASEQDRRRKWRFFLHDECTG